ncbi:MAG: transcription antitermination factor NusB [Paludibacteraceae bacterium]|jgi:transcription antitermination protein NusB|nr:transcription antitermination factor NusB [Paludibacteraceae bacterium]
MINRILLRIKVVQVLYAFYHSDNCDKAIAENELRHSLQKAYDLYFYLLALMVELTRFAEQKIDAARNKYLPTDKEKNPQMRFVENLFVKQLSENEQLNEYLKKRKLSWVNYQDALKRMYQEITESDFFADYMSVDEHSYDADKNLWKKIFKMEMSDGSPLLATLEDENAYWLSDVDIIGSFVFKTIKMFKQENASAQELLPMYKDPADLAFALKLFHTTIDCYEEFGKMIDEHVKNWEIDRIAFMDTLIMKTAIAELLSFPTIPTNVTLNEYIEIAKMFSTPRSSLFINGVLDQIAAYLKADNQLEKLVDFTRDTK